MTLVGEEASLNRFTELQFGSVWGIHVFAPMLSEMKGKDLFMK